MRATFYYVFVLLTLLQCALLLYLLAGKNQFAFLHFFAVGSMALYVFLNTGKIFCRKERNETTLARIAGVLAGVSLGFQFLCSIVLIFFLLFFHTAVGESFNSVLFPLSAALLLLHSICMSLLVRVIRN